MPNWRRKLKNNSIKTTVPPDKQIREVLNNTMAGLGLVAQSIANATDFPDDRAKAIFYVRIVTGIVQRASQMMMELNMMGVEKIRRKFSIKDEEIFRKNPGFVV